MMNKRHVYPTHVGVASILLIFMVLSLVSFAALTVVNSKADYTLSEKMFDRSELYTDACHEANAFIAETASFLQDAYEDCEDKGSFLSELDESEFSKSIPLGDYQTLDVTVKAVEPSGGSGALYKVTSYRVVTHDEDLELDETLPVIK